MEVAKKLGVQVICNMDFFFDKINPVIQFPEKSFGKDHGHSIVSVNICDSEARDVFHYHIKKAAFFGCSAISVRGSDCFRSDWDSTVQEITNAIIDISTKVRNSGMAFAIIGSEHLINDLIPHVDICFGFLAQSFNRSHLYKPVIDAGIPTYFYEHRNCRAIPGAIVIKKTEFFATEFEVVK
jgi:hypothetical protein